MKKSDLTDKSKVFYLGRGVIILVIVLSTSLSFLLGFFVGRNTTHPVADQATLMTLPPVAMENVSGTETRDSSSPQPEEGPTAQTTQMQKNPADSDPSQEERQTALEIAQSLRTHQEEEARASTPEGKNGISDRGKDTKSSSEIGDSGRKVRYTVQIGAFKHRSEADSLKSKFMKKGYKTFIEVSKPKNKERLFKVLVGEYSTRKEAELFSVKIKRREGLRTFVTPRVD